MSILHGGILLLAVQISFFSVSTDNGQTFSAPENISDNTGNSFDHLIAIKGNNVYLAWIDDTPGNTDIFFSVSTDNGQTFSTPENISDNTGNSFDHLIAIKGNNVYLAWIDDTPGNTDIFFSVSTDNGQTFSTPENISENTGFSLTPKTVVKGNNVYLAWIDDTPGNDDIFFSVSTDNGKTFSTPDNINENTGFSFDHLIAVK